VPSMEMVRMVSSGTEATMSAIRLARGFTGRDSIIKFEGCYHGHSDSLLVKAGSGLLTQGVPSSAGVPAAFAKHTLTLPFNDIAAVEQMLNEVGQDVACIIVEPVAGNMNCVPPAPGFLEGLREQCDKHGVVLIFDEVITGYGRIGEAFASQRWEVTPDIITTAKGLTNGAIPMGAVFVSTEIHDAFMQGPANMIEFFHGYTYSGHPVAAAAALATLDIYQRDGLLTRVRDLEIYWQEALHSLKGLPNVVDIRNAGLVGAVHLATRDGAPGARGYDVFEKCFWEGGLMVRCTGDIIAMSPPLIADKSHLDRIVEALGDVIKRTP